MTEAATHLPIPVLLSPIVGVDLVKYAGQYSEQLFEMQKQVDAIIPAVNIYVKKANDEMGLITPNISSCIHKCRGRGKGYRTHYVKLTDGCHPSEEVKSVWADAMVNCCRANVIQ